MKRDSDNGKLEKDFQGQIASKINMVEPEFEPVRLPVDGLLDLHTFSPKEVPSVVREYIGVCLEEKIFEIRIIHGKGKGILRNTVHSLLKKDPRVLHFSLDTGPSGWGATLAFLRRR